MILYWITEYSLEKSRSSDIQKVVKLLDNKAQDQEINPNVIFYGVYTITRVKCIKTELHKRYFDLFLVFYII